MKNLDIFLDRVESDGIIVATNNADEVPVGTVFTQLVKIRAGDASDAGSGIELCSTPVRLCLSGAVIFRKSVPAIPRGWSAGLRLDGAGLDAVTDALSGKVAGEFIHLRAADAA
jgi:hypothetical protein